MNFPFGETITLRTRTVSGQNDYGNDVYTTTTTTVVGGFAPNRGYETTTNGDVVVSQPVVYLPPGTVLGSVDQVTVRGVTYAVDGVPADWRHPMTGWAPGIEVPLKDVTG